MGQTAGKSKKGAAKSAGQQRRSRPPAGAQRSGTASAATSRTPPWREPPARPRRKMRPQTGVSHRGRGDGSETQRITLRLDENTSRALVRVGLVAVAVMGLGLGLAQLLRLPAWAVSASSTQVGGSHRVSPEMVYAASQVDGRSIFWLQPGEVAERVEALPGIGGAVVHLRLPDQVIIDVREQEPLVAWHGAMTTTWLAADGEEVPAEGDPPPLELTDRSGEAVASPQARRLLLPHLAALRQADPELHHVYYGPLEGLYFVTPEGWTVYLGDNGPMAEKMAMLEAVRSEILAQGATPTVIDLRSDARQALWW